MLSERFITAILPVAACKQAQDANRPPALVFIETDRSFVNYCLGRFSFWPVAVVTAPKLLFIINSTNRRLTEQCRSGTTLTDTDPKEKLEGSLQQRPEMA